MQVSCFWKLPKIYGLLWKRCIPTAEYFSCSWFVWEVIPAAIGWSFSLWHYSELKEALDELDFYQPLVLNLKVLQRYLDKLAVAKFLSALDPSLGNQVRRQILGGDTIPSLYHCLECFFWCWKLCYGSWGMWTRSWSWFRWGRERWDKGPSQGAHCGRNNHISDKYCDKFGKPETQVTDFISTSALVTTSSINASTMHRSPRQTECFLQL